MYLCLNLELQHSLAHKHLSTTYCCFQIIYFLCHTPSMMFVSYNERLRYIGLVVLRLKHLSFFLEDVHAVEHYVGVVKV